MVYVMGMLCGCVICGRHVGAREGHVVVFRASSENTNTYLGQNVQHGVDVQLCLQRRDHTPSAQAKTHLSTDARAHVHIV